MANSVIFDIGMHKGEDTKHYLKMGFSVIALEANPVLAKAGEEKFENYIKEKRLEIINKGISNTNETQKFWINHKYSEWSSFEKELGCRGNLGCHSVEISPVNIEELIEKYGVPFYLKIDIEGYDGYCLEQIPVDKKPKYLSFEASDFDWLISAKNKGYTKFKFINQLDGFKAFNAENEQSKIRLLRNKVRWRLLKIFGNKASFPCGSSGPFAENTDGDWKSFEDIKSYFEIFNNNGKTLNTHSWFDVHATF